MQSAAHRKERQKVTLAVTSAATLLVMIVYTAVPITLVQTAASLHASAASQSWMLNGMNVGLSSLLMVIGTIADDYGRKLLFMAGLLVLALTSTLSAVSMSPGLFIATRLGEGAASGAILAASLGLIGAAFPAAIERARAAALWGAMLGAGVAVGPLFTSLFAGAGSWRTVYWLLAAVALLTALLGMTTLDETRAERRQGADLLGAATLTAGLACLLAALVTAGQGWGQPRVLELVAASAALLVVFWRIEAAADRPMLDPRLWRRPVFVAATLAALFTGLSVIGLMSYLPTVLERVIGLTPWATSQLFALWAGTSFVATMLARRRGFGLHGHRSVAVGLAVSAAGDLALWGLTRSAGVWHLIPGLVVSGVGYGLLNAVIGRLALESVPDRGSTGSGVNNATRYIGSGIGVTLLMAVSRPSVGPAATMVHDPNLALVIGAAIAVLGAVSIATVRDTPQSVVLAAQAQAPND